MSEKKRYIPSEEYRAMLVRDGERRYREWHTSYIKHQKEYLIRGTKQRSKVG